MEMILKAKDSNYLVDEDNNMDEVDVDMEEFECYIDEAVEFIGCRYKVQPLVDEEEDGEDVEVLDNDYFENASDGEDEDQVKAYIKEHSIKTRREIRMEKIGNERVRAICKGVIPSLPAYEDLVFNRKLVGRRDKPIIVTLEFAREYLMKRIVNVNKVIKRCHGPLTPTAIKILKANSDEAKKYSVDWGGDKFYQFSGPWGGQVVVNVMARTCTYGRWELTGRIHLSKCNVSTTLLPPEYQPQMDRPKTKRRKSKAKKDVLKIVKNGKLSREHKTVTCDKCKTKDHNSRSCTRPRVPNSKKRKTSSK
ncbi:hypothetical protein Tco_1057399 [Tanacetum coccineum]|uniref:Transposase n=1 Tax=Tanacetum coccineum TaxID=301880 RepID=A0ABQ5H587_9ASTR